MKRIIGAALLVICSAGSATADINTTVEGLLADVKQLSQAHEARWGYNAAPETLGQAFEAAGIGFSMRYVDSWSGWLWLDWKDATGVFGSTSQRLRDWRGAVNRGQADEAQTEAMLRAGVARLHALNARMQIWFEDDLKNEIERGRWLDLADAVDCCDEPWTYYHTRADQSFDDSISPNYWLIGRIALIPPVPEDGAVPDLASPNLDALNQSVAEAIAEGDAAAIRGLIRDAEALLHFSDDPRLLELAQILRLTRDRLAYADAPVTDLLDRAQDLEQGSLRDAVLQEAQDALLDRAAHMAEVLAGSEVSQDQRESARSWILANAKRLSQLVDDAQGRFDKSSAASRLFAGLSAASQALDAGERGSITGTQAAQILQDLADSLPAVVSPIAPFSGPMGAVSAQLDSTRSGFELAAQALDGVSDAIGGDESGLERAQTAARQLEDVLNPKRIVKNMTDGFVSGVVNNVPFARSIYEWLKS